MAGGTPEGSPPPAVAAHVVRCRSRPSMAGRVMSVLDREATALAERIAELGEGEEASVYRMSWWSDRMLGWAMSHPSFKTQLFRFVDVFPATHSDADVLRHVREYFDGADVPRALDMGVGIADRVPGGGAMTATIARRNIKRMAEQFIVGTGPEDAAAGLHRLWKDGAGFVVDLLGEKTVTEAEADRYAARVEELVSSLLERSANRAPDDALEHDDIGRLPRVQVSIKPTALASQFGPLTREQGLEQAKARLRPILRMAAERGALVWFDMEHYDVKDLTLQLFRELLDEPGMETVDAGCVIQAYLKDSLSDLSDLVAWSSGRRTPVSLRLVKGAYWDAETIHSRAEGWPVPVFEHKAETDANYERCTRFLHDHHGQVRAAFASHNFRSLAYAITYGRALAIPDSGYELQMLYGMAEPVQAAIRRMGMRLRVYAPVGELVPGMAYLVRRLLENTSNESFVRHRFAEGRDLDELLAPPSVSVLPEAAPLAARADTDPENPSPYEPEPPAEWRRQPVRAAFASAVAKAPSSFGVDVPAVIGGKRTMTSDRLASTDPAEPSSVIASVASCGVAEADAAVEAAAKAWDGWRRTSPNDRAAVLFRAAAWMRARRDDLSALEVFEA